MCFKLVHQKNINRQKWDKLVDDTPRATVFAKSFYLDSTADDWYAYMKQDYSFAIPLGSTKKLGIESVYPPFFHRYTEILGDLSLLDKNDLYEKIKNHFSYGSIQSKEKILPKNIDETFVFQSLNKDNFKLKNQAKRMLKKANEKEYQLSSNISTAELSQLIIDTMAEKVAFFTRFEAKRLSRLVLNAEKHGYLIKLGIIQNKTLKGGVFGLMYNNKVLYLKGACESEVKKNGGMYLLMYQLINTALKKNCNFDFGGSRIENVRYFNTRFNGQDEAYFYYKWNNAPVWFKLIQLGRKWIRK